MARPTNGRGADSPSGLPLEPEPLSILFVCRDPGRVRNFERPLEIMAARGHRVHVALEKPRERIPGQEDFIRNLAASHSNVTYGRAAKRESDGWSRLGRSLRLGLDHLHFSAPEFDSSPLFQQRAEEASPELVRRLARMRIFRGRGRRALVAALAALERALPSSRRYEAYIAKLAPDLVLVSPFVWFGAQQTDWVRSAKRLGITTVACIFSWDNLSSKGSIREMPDRMIVWNETQKREAVTLHGVPASRIACTGAQGWDGWFAREPSRTREQFCSEVGLDPDRPYLLYSESSGYTKGEPEFVSRWVASLRREGGEGVSSLAVLVRPHPQTVADGWVTSGVASLEDVVVWPPDGEMPLNETGRANFFDSIHYAAGVVGINTTSFIDSAILSKACLAFTPPEYKSSQAETQHFRYLLEENGGHLLVAETIGEHLEQLRAVVSGEVSGAERAARFVETFVRPAGPQVEAGSRFVAEVEDAGALRSVRHRPGLGSRVLRAAASPVARNLETGDREGSPV